MIIFTSKVYYIRKNIIIIVKIKYSRREYHHQIMWSQCKCTKKANYNYHVTIANYLAFCITVWAPKIKENTFIKKRFSVLYYPFLWFFSLQLTILLSHVPSSFSLTLANCRPEFSVLVGWKCNLATSEHPE